VPAFNTPRHEPSAQAARDEELQALADGTSTASTSKVAPPATYPLIGFTSRLRPNRSAPQGRSSQQASNIVNSSLLRSWVIPEHWPERP